VFISHGSTGDIVPVIRLAATAVERGHIATLLASHHWKESIESQGIRFRPIPPAGDQSELTRLMTQYSAIRNRLRLLEAMYRHIDEWQEDILPTLQSALKDADVLLYSYLFPHYQSEAKARGIPSASIHFCPNTSFSPSHPPDDLPQLPSFLPQRIRYFWNQYLTRIGDRYVTRRINRQISRPKQHLRQWLRTPSDLSLVLAPPELYRGSESDLPPSVVFAGFAKSGYSTREFAEIPEISHSPLLNFGSVAHDSMRREFARLYQSWPSDQSLTIQRGWFSPPPPPPDKPIRLIDPASHEPLFHQASIIIHHGGAGTTTSAFLAGKPQVIIPHFADQSYWARTVHSVGCGLPLKQRGWGTRLALAVSKIQNDPSFRRSALTFAERQKDRPGAVEAIRAVETKLLGGAS